MTDRRIATHESASHKPGRGIVGQSNFAGTARKWKVMAPDKKRLMWILVMIFFFFANMVVVVLMLFGGLGGKK
jgi:hypothetical protein